MDLNEVPGAPFRRHPWEVARARFFARVVESAGCFERACRVLDIGAGDGFLGRQLLAKMAEAETEGRRRHAGGAAAETFEPDDGGSVACFDAHYTDEDLARFADPPTRDLTFHRRRPGGAFDLILLLDVLEHVADDRAFLSEMVASSLGPGGAALISVPAWELLYGRHDVELKHFRRYSPAGCRALLESAGLQIVRAGGLFHSLLLPRLLQRLSEGVLELLRPARGKQRPANLGEWRGGALLSSMVELALAADNRASALLAGWGREVPGLSYWALCRKVTA
jgi:SAM-dependent methyltransferase